MPGGFIIYQDKFHSKVFKMDTNKGILCVSK